MKLFQPFLIGIVLGFSISPNARAGESIGLADHVPSCIELRDQYDSPKKLSFPTTNVTLLTIADKKGSVQVDGWIAALKPLYAGRIVICGLADIGGAPGFLQGRIRKSFQEARKHPVMLDWSGKVCAQIGYKKDEANLLVLDRAGRIQARFTGLATPAAITEAAAVLDQLLSAEHQHHESGRL
jgi:hypothetical protein